MFKKMVVNVGSGLTSVIQFNLILAYVVTMYFSDVWFKSFIATEWTNNPKKNTKIRCQQSLWEFRSTFQVFQLFSY